MVSHSAGTPTMAVILPCLRVWLMVSPVRSGNVGDASSVRQRHEHAGRELEGVVQRQHRHHAVGNAQVEDARHLRHLEGEVPVREHDALGVAGRPRGEDERRHRVGRHAWRRATSCARSPPLRRASSNTSANGQMLAERPASPSSRDRVGRLSRKSSPTIMPTAPAARAIFDDLRVVESWATGTAVAPALRIPK